MQQSRMQQTLAVILTVVAACGGAAKAGKKALAGNQPVPGSRGAAGVRLPPINAPFDYQLGGAYPPPSGVQIVSRDRAAAPATGLYNICYVNGFQIQPGELDTWQASHPDLILKDSVGQPIVDSNWNEVLIDVSTPQKRASVAAIVGAWIDGCASAGYDAIEIDNLDSYSRSQGTLSADDCVAALGLFAERAHAQHLAIAQKNASELVTRRGEMGTDFAVVEECNRFSECDTYRAGYGDSVLLIEYVKDNFMAGCHDYPELSIVLRDLYLVTPGTAGYVDDGC